MATEKRGSVLSRINPRMLVIAAVILGPLGWMVYIFAEQSLSHGIETVGNYKQVDLKAMGNFPFSDVSGTLTDIPQVYANLDGQKVLLIGEQYAGDSSAPVVDKFQLVYSIQKCCFGGPPKVQERVFAKVPQGGRRVPMYGSGTLAKVYGTLHVRPIVEHGQITSVYDMDIERVEPMGQ